MTLSLEITRDYPPCTDGDLVSAGDKGEQKIEGFGKISLTFQESNFTLSLKSRAYPSDDITLSLLEHSMMLAKAL